MDSDFTWDILASRHAVLTILQFNLDGICVYIVTSAPDPSLLANHIKCYTLDLQSQAAILKNYAAVHIYLDPHY